MTPTAAETGDFSAIRDLLSNSGFPELIRDRGAVILKPNLIGDYPHPVTTSPDLIFEVAGFIRDTSPSCRIVVAEGCGSPGVSTNSIYRNLGYTAGAARTGVELVDLNEEPTRRLSRDDAAFFSDIQLPECVLEGLLVSVPVLKAHSMAEVTLALKNMVGLLPPKAYAVSGHWLKAHIHSELHTGIVELNQYRKPDFCILDGTVGMARAHLWGPQCEPPVRVLACGTDPVAIDALGAGLLGFDWEAIGHIKQADGLLGSAADGTLALEELGRA